MSGLIFSLHALIISGFCISILVIIISYLLLKQARTRIIGLLVTSHLLLLGATCIKFIASIIELVFIFTHNDPANRVFLQRATGIHWYAYWCLILIPLLTPQILWWPQMRKKIWVALLVMLGTTFPFWIEPLVIIIASMHRDALPVSWRSYGPEWMELLVVCGIYSVLLGGSHYLRMRVKRPGRSSL